MELVPEPLRVCLVFIFDAHDGAGALWYYRGVCHDSRAHLLSLHQKTISLPVLSATNTYLSLLQKRQKTQSSVSDVICKGERGREQTGELQWEHDDGVFGI